MKRTLAIVIPAYKATFLPAALDSIAAQTCQEFTLYIGDDCSPNHLENIVCKYKDKVNLVYKRFETNLGGTDLVAQWERCIAMTQGEPYIWIFSDDDVMEPRCVEVFLTLPAEIRDNYVVHYNIHVINEDGSVIKTPLKYPQVMSSKEFLDAKLFHKGCISYVVEFVFPRWVHEKTEGFQNYDLAWGSDFMTWLKFADACKGIYTIDAENSKIRWRYSSENISPNRSNDIQVRKIKSQIMVAKHIQDFLQREGYNKSFRYVRFPLGDIKRSLSSFMVSDIVSLCQAYKKIVGWPVRCKIAEFVLLLFKYKNKIIN